MLYYERKFRRQGRDLIIGIDEAGRGPLAGPVVAAAVYLKTFSFVHRIDDSKKLTALQRQQACLEIFGKSVFGIGIINEKVIDRVNILNATSLAMEQALAQLIRRLAPDDTDRIQVLVDGTVRIGTPLPVCQIIRGDGRSQSIAAASIIAKVSRDRIMCVYDRIFPQYRFIEHKGYGTEAHRRAISHFGRSAIHRATFVSAV